MVKYCVVVVIKLTLSHDDFHLLITILVVVAWVVYKLRLYDSGGGDWRNVAN